MENLIHYVDKDTNKLVVVNLNIVAKFREGNEPAPRLWVSYPHAPEHYIHLQYLWKDFIRNFYSEGK